MTEKKVDAHRFLRWKMPSKRQVLTVSQAHFVGTLIQELSDALPLELPLEVLHKIYQEELEAFFELPEYKRLLLGLEACGFVANDGNPNFPLDMANLRPEEHLGTCDLTELRWYLHTLTRAERKCDGYGSPLFQGLLSGTVQLVGRRLIGDERLRAGHS